jgi:hypothetical protein
MRLPYAGAQQYGTACETGRMAVGGTTNALAAAGE